MLVLTRKISEVIEFQVPPSDQPQVIRVTVARIQGHQVRIGAEADPSVQIGRPKIETWPVVTVADAASLEVAKRQYGAA